MVLDTHLQPCIPVETVSPPLCDMLPRRSYDLIIGAIDKGCQVKLVLDSDSAFVVTKGGNWLKGVGLSGAVAVGEIRAGFWGR
jgi:hypothetical protein